MKNKNSIVEFMIESLLLLIMIVALLIPFISIYLSEKHCSNYLSITKSEGIWDIFSGCYVEKNGELINLKLLRQNDVLKND